MDKPIIISLSGSAQHGKDSSVDIIQRKLELMDKRCLHVAYGNYLKFICEKYYGWNGKKDESGRTTLQKIGTDKIRKNKATFWVDAVIDFIDVVREDYDYILISDCRFPDEIYRWVDRDYQILAIHVDRPNFDNGLTNEQKNHPSETALDDFEFDFCLSAKNLEELKDDIEIKLHFLFEG